MVFEDLNKSSVKDMEKEISNYWEDIDILKGLLKPERDVKISYFMKDLQQLTVDLESIML